MASLSLSPQERNYYDSLFAIVDKDKSGLLPGQDALPFLMSSGLSQQTLGEVWAIADPENNGFLTAEGWYKAARLIGWMQKGNQSVVDESLVFKGGPLPTFKGQAPPPPPLTAQITGHKLPNLTPADRTKFTKIFVGCGPHNGVITGEKARDVFVKSKLGYDKLAQIWNLADTQQRGSLDLPDFIIGMYLIQSCMADPSLQLPTTLPPGVYEQASGGRARPTTPISRQNTGVSSPSRLDTASPVRPQYTGLQPPRPGSAIVNSPSGPVPYSAAWDVSPEAKAASDRFFNQLDTSNRGVIDGEVAVPFMLQSQLDEGVLAAIWDLADIRHEGQLDRDEFAVAMHLINGKLAGRDVPKVLPPSLIPPSLRNLAGTKEVLAPAGQSSAARDLFDLDFDEPPPTAAPAIIKPNTPGAPEQAISPQVTANRAMSSPPPDKYAPFSVMTQRVSSLLDDESVVVLESSADLGNKQNELNNTQRGLDELAKSRSQLETTVASSAARLEELEHKLSDARVKHEAESKAVTDLRSRVDEQSARIKQLNSDVISAESDLSAMRSEKDELEQAWLTDKEEVRRLQRRIKEVDEEKTALKAVLEKLRKEARQQKGMVTITKKQLSTAEGSRDATKQEIILAESSSEPETAPSPITSFTQAAPFSPSILSTAAGIALPSTPQALSPAPTGTSQRSKNPFNMFRSAQSTENGSGPMALAGAAMGAVVNGAEGLYNVAKDAVAPLSSEKEHDAQPPKSEHEAVMDPFGVATNDRQEGLDAAPSEPPADFASAFADFEAPAPAVDQVDLGTADTTSGDDLPSSINPIANDDHLPVPPVPDETRDQNQVQTASIPTGIPKSALPTDLRLDNERTLSTRALAPSSRPESPEDLDHPAETVSSDEDEGPEDLEAPRPFSEGTPPVLSAPVGDAEQKGRRSAPPPPTKAANIVDLDPFGVPNPANPAGEPTPKTGGFDDEEFDFSDLPPAQVDATPQVGVSYDDDFAGFDDDFDRPTGSENSGKSYEMVSPVQHTSPQPTSVPAMPAPETSRHYDEWGLGGKPSGNSAPSTLSFDDAFGGESEHVPVKDSPQKPSPQHNSTPAGLASTSLAPPTMPLRRESQSQPDDLEDVKRLCNMGFPRTLVIDALEANDYDFQKTLNVLLQ